MNDIIKERMIEFAMNIAEFEIGEEIVDLDKTICVIKNKTINSIEVEIKRKSKNGVNSTQWFDMRDFNKRFKKK